MLLVSGLLLEAEQRSNQGTTGSTKDGGMMVKLNENGTGNGPPGEEDELLMQRIQKYLVRMSLIVISLVTYCIIYISLFRI